MRCDDGRRQLARAVIPAVLALHCGTDLHIAAACTDLRIVGTTRGETCPTPYYALRCSTLTSSADQLRTL